MVYYTDVAILVGSDEIRSEILNDCTFSSFRSNYLEITLASIYSFEFSDFIRFRVVEK